MPSRREQAGMPLYPKLRRDILTMMRRMSLPADRATIIEGAADELGLTADHRKVPCANGSMPEYADRVGWALSDLKAQRLVENVTRGIWDLTEEGRVIGFDDLERRVKDARREYHRRRRIALAEPAEPDVEEPEEDGEVPHEGSNWIDQLLKRLHALSPGGFERLARELLLSAGFDEVKVTQLSHDGGIDGVGTYRPSGLISFRTAFQCKRWKNTPVGAPEVQAFQGAIQGQADRGIIITTSYFTSDANRQAGRSGAMPIDLIPGERLAELLKEHKVGVRTEMVEQITIDTDYFDRFDKDHS